MIGNNPFAAKRKKFGVMSLLITLIVGIVFIGVGFMMHKSTTIPASWQRVDGIVVDVATESSTNSGQTYAPVINYTVNGVTYKITSSISSSSYPTTGTYKQVAYDPSNPKDAKVVVSGSTSLLFYIFPLVGVIAVIAAPIAFVKSLRRTEDINHLKKDGQKIQGIITNIETEATNNYNNGNNSLSYKITVSATAPDGSVKTYLSDLMSGIGSLSMSDYRTHPIPLDVYINPANPDDYYVDISEVPSLTPERIMQLISEGVHGQQAQSIAPQQTPGISAAPPSQSPAFQPAATAPSIAPQAHEAPQAPIAPQAPAAPETPVMPQSPVQPESIQPSDAVTPPDQNPPSQN